MASYKDTVPTFNPYVKQLPLEAMVQVGMYKQQKYEEGIQKIQTSIDNIAGLDVYNNADKAYLQSKLNQLGNDLTTVAAGDFSNFQLVNSTTGMISQIARDPNVRNAVGSTSFIRKEQEFMENARKEGKLHKNNEIYFNDRLSEYASSDKVGQVFNTKYQPYTDYQKKWRDIKKEFDIKEDTSDLPFLMDKAGRYIDTKGNVLPPGSKPIPNDYMIRETFKGVDPEKLKKAITSAIDDNDYAQMKIDAYVKYRGYTPDMLATLAKERFEETQAPLLENIKNLNILKYQNAGNQNALDIINKQLSSYNNTLESNKAEFDKSLPNLYKNPEQFKNNIFVMDSINEFTNAFSNISHIQQVVDSPIVKKMQEDRRYNFDVIKFKTDNDHWEKDYNLSVRKQLGDEKNEEFKKKMELWKYGLGPNPLADQVAKYKGAPSTDEEVLDGIIESFQQEASLYQLGKDQNVLKGQWAKTQNVDPKELEKTFLSDLNGYRNNPNKKGASWNQPGTRRIFEEYDRLDKLQKLKMNTINDVRAKVDKEFEKEESAVTSKLKKEKGFSGFSAKDIYDIDRNVNKYITYGATTSSGLGYGSSGKTEFDDEGARINLSAKEFEFYKRYKNKYYGANDSFISEFQKRSRELKSKYQGEYGKILKAKDNAFLINLKDRINSIIPVTQALPTGSAGKFTSLVENKFAREQKGKTEEAPGFIKGEDFNLDTTRNLMLNKNTIPTYTTYGNDVYVTLSGKINDKPVVQKFKVSKEEFNDSFPGVITDDTDIDFVKSSAANGSTNYKYTTQNSAQGDSNNAFVTASYKNNNTKKYIVKGDIFFDPNNKNLTVPMIYVKNPNTGNTITISGDEFIPFTDAKIAIENTINDVYINNYLKNNNINANF